MDKKRFIEMAPLYYELAIKTALGQSGGRALSLQGIVDKYKVMDEDDPSEPIELLGQGMILDRAMEWLRQNEMVTFIDDDFGLPLLEQGSPWASGVTEIQNNPSLPFYKFNRAADGDAWLHSALSSISAQYYQLGITAEDFKNPDAQWAPLPLDRAIDSTLQKAIEALDATLKHVREDNGYAANVPEERNYVLESLTTATRVLKTEATTSVPFIRRYVLEPLALLGRRFSNAALGVLSDTAKELVKDFLKEHGAEWLAALFGGP
jgi:hypothetical protein